QRRHRLGQHVLVRRRFGQKHLGDARELGGRIRDHTAVLAGDQHVDVAAERLGGGERLVGCVLESLVVVLGNQERSHHSTPASFFSLPTSSATELTFTPALRPGGSVVLRTSRRGEGSTP